MTSNHHCIFTMPSTCTSHYYFGSPTFDLSAVTFTLPLLVTAKLPEWNIPSMPKRYIWWVLRISRICSDRWPTFQGQIGQRHMSVCLSIQFLLTYIHYWYQTIIAYLQCPVLVPPTIILALWPLTLAQWPLPLLCLLRQNCLNETSHQCQHGTFAAFCQYRWWVRRAVTLVELWPTFQGHIGHHDLGHCLLVQYCLNKTSHQCQNGTFGEFYQYLSWVLTFDLLFKVR